MLLSEIRKHYKHIIRRSTLAALGVCMCVLAADPAVLFAAGETNGTSASVQTQTAGGTKIHFISLHSTTDAILLESNGHFDWLTQGKTGIIPMARIIRCVRA